MCYTVVTHFNRCSHRSSTTTLCPRSTQYLPSIYHPPRPCATDSREQDFFVCRDQLCDACLIANFWFSGSGWPNSRTRRYGSDSRKNKKQEKGPKGRMAEAHSSNHHRSSPGQRVSAWRQGVTAESLDPILTHAVQVDGGRCPLSEAFERMVRIEDDGGAGAGASADDWSQEEEEEEEWSDGIENVRTRERKGAYGPFRPTHFPSDDIGDRSGGSFSRLGGHGGHSRRTRRRTAGNKKRVRFARETEMVCFRGDSATRTLASLGREYKACR